MSVTDFAAIAASINQRLGQVEAAQTSASGAVRAAIVAAVIAALAAILSFIGVFLTARVLRRNGFLQARATQQMKHADFRQAWINGLREEMANFLRLSTERRNNTSKESEVIQSMAMIPLRMDRRDPRYDALVDAMDDVLDATNATGMKRYGAAAGDYLVISQKILKREWDTTKRAMHEEPPEWGQAMEKDDEPDTNADAVKMPRYLDASATTDPAMPPGVNAPKTG